MKPKSNYMPPDQFKQVLDAIPTLHIRRWGDSDIQMLFKICYWLGLRFGEAIRLKVEDFDLSSGLVSLGTTKANKNDEAAIPPDFVLELEPFLLGRTGQLFPGLTYNTAIKWIQRLGKQLHILAWITSQSETGEKTKTHIFRKSIAKDLMYGTYGSKADITIISKTLRHKGKNPLATTFHYIKGDSQDVKNWWDSNKKTEN